MLAEPAEWKGRSGRALLALLLTVISGIATASYAGYVLWSDTTRCNPPPAGYTCTISGFWGAPASWLAIECLAGVAFGLLTALVGWELHRRAFGIERGSYAILVLALAGLIAYGGLIVGTACGIAGSLLFATLRTRRTGAPSEWSGVLPIGVTAVKTPPRPVVEKPAVSEWNGVSLPAVPPKAEPAPETVPSADRLAAALARVQRLSPTRAAPVRKPAVVLLPPPPSGIGGGTSPSLLPRSAVVPSPGPSPTPPSKVEPSPPRTPTPMPPPLPPSRSTRSPAPTATVPPSEPAAVVARPPAGAPLAHAATGSPPMPKAPAPTRAPARAEPARPPATNAGPLPPTRAPSTVPPPGTGQARIRAWVCPNCRLTNAPWSDHCTRCRAPAPPHS